MKNPEVLIELERQVSGGEWISLGAAERDSGLPSAFLQLAWRAYRGCSSSAMELLSAELPAWSLSHASAPRFDNGRWAGNLTKKRDGDVDLYAPGHGTNLGAAILSAILRAKVKDHEQASGRN